MKLRRLDWDEPLLPQACRELLKRASGPVLDLSHLLVVVPTTQSGRRFGEALAITAAKERRGLLPPRFVTPDRLLGDPGADTASEACAVAAWAEVLGRINAATYPHVFPRLPDREVNWTLGMALRLTRLQAVLGEEGYDCARVAEAVADGPCEPQRWRELAELEDRFRSALASRGLRDLHAVRFGKVESPELPAGIREVIVACVADPLPIALRALDRLAESHPVEIWTYGPVGSEAFDAHGRPGTDFWSARFIEMEAMGAKLHNPASPDACAAIVANAAAGKRVDSITLGLADHSLTAPVAKGLAALGLQSYDPSGIPLNRGGSGHLTDLLCRLPEEPGAETVRGLIQHPDVWLWLKPQLAGTSQGGLLRELDALCKTHLPADLDGLLFFAQRGEKWAALKTALDAVRTLRERLEKETPFGDALRNCLREIYRVRTVDTSDEHDAEWVSKADALRGILENGSVTEKHFPDLGTPFMRPALRHAISAEVTHPERPHEAHDLLGWLELLWTDAPDLVLAGLNEGLVPEAVAGDAFLPETIRRELGMRTNASRFARDAYLLAATCHWRARSGGRIDLIAPQSAADGTPHKPSRLLFLCDDASLLKRTKQLFSESGTSAPSIHRGRTWKLRPPAARPVSLSVSKLSAWLRCPFRFCLAHVLKMESVDTNLREMDPLIFGSLFHDTVQTIKGWKFDAGTNASELSGHLQNELTKQITQRFGKALSFALRLQEEALLARLRAFADRQIESVAHDGAFEVIATEEDFVIELESGPIAGRIDRIDRLADGSLRLIDYKTSDTAKTPFKAHLKSVGKKGRASYLPDAAFVAIDGKEYQWTDLQLPLYAEAKRKETGGVVRPAYFNLPKSRDKAGLEPFGELSPELVEAAVRCAEAVAQEIQAGHFWPPNPDLPQEYDDFARLFPDGLDEAVEVAAFANFSYGEEVPS